MSGASGSSNKNLSNSRLNFSTEVRILRKNYIAPVPQLRVACVLPGGPFFPDRTHEMSDSESD